MYCLHGIELLLIFRHCILENAVQIQYGGPRIKVAKATKLVCAKLEYIPFLEFGAFLCCAYKGIFGLKTTYV